MKENWMCIVRQLIDLPKAFDKTFHAKMILKLKKTVFPVSISFYVEEYGRA